jgi:hypothetical protein
MASLKFNSVGPILEEGVSATTQTPSVEVGVRRVYQGEEYVYAYNAGGAAIDKNWGAKFVTGASGYSVAATALTDVYSPFVGVVKHVTMLTGDYGWLLIKGFATVKMVTAVTGDYKQIALGASGLFIEASGTTTLGTACAVGFALSHNTGAGGSVYAYIKANV